MAQKHLGCLVPLQKHDDAIALKYTIFEFFSIRAFFFFFHFNRPARCRFIVTKKQKRRRSEHTNTFLQMRPYATWSDGSQPPHVLYVPYSRNGYISLSLAVLNNNFITNERWKNKKWGGQRSQRKEKIVLHVHAFALPKRICLGNERTTKGNKKKK